MTGPSSSLTISRPAHLVRAIYNSDAGFMHGMSTYVLELGADTLVPITSLAIADRRLVAFGSRPPATSSHAADRACYCVPFPSPCREREGKGASMGRNITR